jgi:hypothetical protein
MRQFGRAPRVPSPPIQLLGCEPCDVDRHVRTVNYFVPKVDARDSPTTYVINVDGTDPEVTVPRLFVWNYVRELPQDV